MGELGASAVPQLAVGDKQAVHVCTAAGVTVAGDWQAIAQRALQAGDIVAVKGIGGFHLACDAASHEAVTRLRQRKGRPRKPFALMASDIRTVESGCIVSEAEREALTSPVRPIVLLRPKPGLARQLPVTVLAPGYSRLGVMLPYTAIHAGLFSAATPWLVMTSGNLSGMPIAATDAEALAQLGEMASLFVIHNHDIPIRVEDSLVQVVDETVVPLRRSRGYVWDVLTVPVPTDAVPAAHGSAETAAPIVLAAGAEQKNSCCLLAGQLAMLSPHHGDIDSEERLDCWRASVDEVTRRQGALPDVIAFDPHPDYLVSGAASRQFPNRPLEPVFHHHAHLAACMAEHGLTQPVIGCILDGTGYGTDETLWGFEILTGDYVSFDRIAHIEPLTLPGGEAAIRQPWLLAVSLLYRTLGDARQTRDWVQRLFPAEANKLPLVLAQLDGRLPVPAASSAGRLFDAVAALLGLCTKVTYEGEAAILLGELAELGTAAAGETVGGERDAAGLAYPASLTDGVLLTAPLVHALLADWQDGVPAPVISQKFHHTVAKIVVCGARLARDRTGLADVILSGGVWNNRYLLSTARRWLQAAGFTVYTHRLVPPGDGGIALGQAVCARWRWQRNVSGRSSRGT